ncbi:MAG: signal peptidase I [Defluviitaleaceae bacterium]|nr:signal peptidase I [Defluviitaleaceae bacterium]
MQFLERIENPILRGAVEWLILIGLAVLLFFVMRAFIFRTAHIDGFSMAPTLEHGDWVILNRFTYIVSAPRAGDITAFPNPENPSEHFVKRIIAVPGDSVDLRGGFFYVNDQRLEDEFSEESTGGTGLLDFPITIDEQQFFLLGDNRNGSQDSRFSVVGTIPRREMVGRAGVRVWPLGRVGLVR